MPHPMVHRSVMRNNKNTTIIFAIPILSFPLNGIHHFISNYLYIADRSPIYWNVKASFMFAFAVAAEVGEAAAAALRTWSFVYQNPEKYRQKHLLKATTATRGMTSSCKGHDLQLQGAWPPATRGMTSSYENQFAKWSSFNLAMRPSRYRSHTPSNGDLPRSRESAPLIVFLISCVRGGGAVPGTRRSTEGSIM